MSKLKIVLDPDSDGAVYRIEGRDEHGFICAQLRWDGCMNLWLKGEVEEGKEAWTEAGRLDNCDYVHLCDPIGDVEGILRFLLGAREMFKRDGKWCGE